MSDLYLERSEEMLHEVECENSYLRDTMKKAVLIAVGFAATKEIKLYKEWPEVSSLDEIRILLETALDNTRKERRK